MGKKDSNTALMEPPDVSKPLVKEFIDKEAEICQFIRTHLPNVGNAIVKFNKVYAAKDKTIHRYRINYWHSQQNQGQITPENHIVDSHYVEVRCVGKELEFQDRTNETNRKD